MKQKQKQLLQDAVVDVEFDYSNIDMDKIEQETDQANPILVLVGDDNG